MEIKLELLESMVDDQRMPSEILDDIHKKIEIRAYKESHNFSVDDDARAFGLSIEYGDNRRGILCDVDLDDLEMFASSILKSIEMLRRDYSGIINKKNENGFKI